MVAFSTRRCRNKDCIERFIPVNPQHWYHEPACAQSERLWSVEEILAEEGALTPGSNPLEIAKAAFGQKNSAVRENMRLRTLREYLTFDSRMFYDEHPEYRLVKIQPPPKDRGKRGEREIIIQLSDWQIGKWESGFGVEATKARIEALKHHVASIVQRQRDAGYAINTIRPCFGGDMIEGCFIYRGQNVTGLDRTGNTHRLTRQVQEAARLQADFAAFCATLAPSVVVEVVGGNHGRPNGPNDYADPEDNFDVMAAWWAADIAANSKHIQWNIHEDWWGGFESMGHYVVMFHGDQWSGAFERIQQLLPQWVAANTFGRKPAIVLTHHRHERREHEIAGIQVIQNGTIDGGSKWFLKAYGKASRPAQNVIVMSEKYEAEAVWPVRFGPAESGSARKDRQ